MPGPAHAGQEIAGGVCRHTEATFIMGMTILIRHVELFECGYRCPWLNIVEA